MDEPPLYAAIGVAQDLEGPLVPTTALRIYAVPGFKRDDAEEVTQRWILCQGLADGSLIVYNLPEEVNAQDIRDDSDSAAVEPSAERPPVSGIALTTLRSPTLGSPRSDLTPNLSRKSSSTNLGSWNNSDEGFALGPRPRGASSASTARSVMSLDLGRDGRAAPAPAVNRTSAAASLSKVKAADDAEMMEHLRAQQRSGTPTQVEHPSVVTKLAGLGRRGLDPDRARSPHGTERVRAPSAERSGANSRTSKMTKLERMLSADYHASDTMVEQIQEEEEEAAHVNSLAASAASPPTAASPRIPAPLGSGDATRCPSIRVLMPGMDGIPVVSISQIRDTASIVVLGKTGLCTVVDVQSGLTICQAVCTEGGQAQQKRLRAPIDFGSVDVLRQESSERDYLLASGHMPADVACCWAEPISTGIVLAFESASKMIVVLDSFTLPGIGPMSLEQTAARHTALWHCQDGKNITRYGIALTDLSRTTKAPVPLRAGHAGFRMPDFLSGTRSTPETAAVSRAPSRTESREQGASDSKRVTRAEEPASLAKAIRDRLKGKDPQLRSGGQSAIRLVLEPGHQILQAESGHWQYLLVTGPAGHVWNATEYTSFSANGDLPKGGASTARLAPGLGSMAAMTQSTSTLTPHLPSTSPALDHVPRIHPEGSADQFAILTGQAPNERLCRLQNRAVALAPVSAPHGQAKAYNIFHNRHINVASSLAPGCVSGNEQEVSSSFLGTGYITCVAARMAGSDGAEYTVTGREDGSLQIYRSSDMSLHDNLTPFLRQVRKVLPVSKTAPKSCQGCLVATDEAGSVAIIDISQAIIRHFIPGGRFPLQQIFVGTSTIVVTYTNGKARAWDLDSLEFRRSTGLESADEMLAENIFEEIKPAADLKAPEKRSNLEIEPTKAAIVNMASLQLAGGESQPIVIKRAIDLLAALWTFNLAVPDYDKAIAALINRASVATFPGMRHDSLSASAGLNISIGLDAWRVSPAQTAHRLLLLATVLVTLLDAEEHEQPAAVLSTALAALLPQIVGKGYCDAELTYFVPFYAQASVHVHQAARLLFEARAARIPDAELTSLADHYTGILKSSQPAFTNLTDGSSHALILLCAVATCRYAVLSASTLREVSRALLSILESPGERQHQMAIDFMQRGFDLWQTYLDPIRCLHALFALATSTTGPASLAAHARAAVLHLAGSHTSLFITTLSNDIVEASTVKERTAVMKLCIHVARKKPAALRPNLGRLVEAVVHSLDPTRTTMRESIQQTATVILNELVSAFSTVAFCHTTQKLAVGTAEGVVNVYDLKTATRLYVLDANAPEVAVISFSPDGRRLVTASLLGHKMTVWKVGTSFSSLFSIGAPPRQGAERGQPFKTIDFALSDHVPHNATTGLPVLSVTWPGPRSACLEVGETKMTFAT